MCKHESTWRTKIGIWKNPIEESNHLAMRYCVLYRNTGRQFQAVVRIPCAWRRAWQLQQQLRSTSKEGNTTVLLMLSSLRWAKLAKKSIRNVKADVFWYRPASGLKNGQEWNGKAASLDIQNSLNGKYGLPESLVTRRLDSVGCITGRQNCGVGNSDASKIF